MTQSNTLIKHYKRYLIGIRYDGNKYYGWDFNGNASYPSVSERLKLALNKFLGDNNYISFQVSSRTDSGVHAIRNCFHVDICMKANMRSNRLQTNTDIHSDTQQLSSYTTLTIKNAINQNLYKQNESIYITDVTEKPYDFNARLDATSRTYIYRIICPKSNTNSTKTSTATNTTSTAPTSNTTKYNTGTNNNNTYANSIPITTSEKLDFQRRYLFHHPYTWVYPYPLDISLMNNAAMYLIGEHDFSAFRHVNCQSKSPYREVLYLHTTKINFSDLKPDLNTDLNLRGGRERNIGSVVGGGVEGVRGGGGGEYRSVSTDDALFMVCILVSVRM